MIEHIETPDTNTKLKLMEFVYDNTDSFIMNTFGYLWQEREWWNKFPVEVYKVGDIIAGLHAYTVNTKGLNIAKTYYIVTGKAFRGQGIAKKLTKAALRRLNDKKTASTYFVNTEEKSNGVKFYKSLFNSEYKIEKNQFGTLDYIFCDKIENILKK
jgi:GNAT superfamily N-acetyltransferase